jgi:plasmid stabilization system protein ParE
MNLRFTPRALAEAKRIKTWWSEHRKGSPDLFETELGAALERIVATPNIGSVYEGANLEVPVRRVLLPRTKNHVYYAIEETVVVVLSIRGAPKGRGPKL